MNVTFAVFSVEADVIGRRLQSGFETMKEALGWATRNLDGSEDFIIRIETETAASRRRGNCYVTCEALYHLLGGKAAGYVPHTVRWEGDVHWYLVLYELPTGYGPGGGKVIDPTASQFKVKPDYSKGRARGFLTKKPSKRARELMDKLVWQTVPDSTPSKRGQGK